MLVGVLLQACLSGSATAFQVARMAPECFSFVLSSPRISTSLVAESTIFSKALSIQFLPLPLSATLVAHPPPPTLAKAPPLDIGDRLQHAFSFLQPQLGLYGVAASISPRRTSRTSFPLLCPMNRAFPSNIIINYVHRSEIAVDYHLLKALLIMRFGGSPPDVEVVQAAPHIFHTFAESPASALIPLRAIFLDWSPRSPSLRCPTRLLYPGSVRTVSPPPSPSFGPHRHLRPLSQSWWLRLLGRTHTPLPRRRTRMAPQRLLRWAPL